MHRRQMHEHTHHPLHDHAPHTSPPELEKMLPTEDEVLEDPGPALNAYLATLLQHFRDVRIL